jgi:hypothetical protein
MNPRLPRPENILPGDHHTMSPAQLRGHYTRGCTHELCRQAKTDYQRERAAAKKNLERAQVAAATPPAPAPEVQERATTAHTSAETPTIPAGRVSAVGASRRLQGLVFAGHAPVDIARATQLSVDAIWWLLLEQHATMSELNHRIIDREFRRMRELLPEPTGKTAAEKDAAIARSKRLARSFGWASPYAWSDIDNDRKPTHRSEAGAANRGKLVDHGEADLLDISKTRPVSEPTSERAPSPLAAVAAPAWAEDLAAAAEHILKAAEALKAVAKIGAA